MDARISDARIIAELDRLAQVPDGESAANVQRAFDITRDVERCQVRWQSAGFGVAFEVCEHHRQLSLDEFSRRVCVPAIERWRSLSGGAH